MNWVVLVCVALVGCGDNIRQSLDNCNDGVFCNGVERVVDGECVKIPAEPCDDGADCTLDTCDEATQRCGHTPMGADCATCRSERCTPECAGRLCGDDGCGGDCGTCTTLQGCTPDGMCSDATGVGTCATPRAFTPMLGVNQVFTGDTTASVHQTVPTCNSASTAVEEVWMFTVTAPMGIEAQSFGYDTVLSLRREDSATTGRDCLDGPTAMTIACSDDSSPPGDYGSRVNASLLPGTYYLIVDGFDATQFGAYTLKVKFGAACVPNCDGQYCNGNDGCGGTCGTCPAGEVCGADLRCLADPCTPDCSNDDLSVRTCGDNGCGGSCGSCATGEMCVPADGSCQTFATCDHDNPVCEPGCTNSHYCGSDCECHFIHEKLPDLVINEQRLSDEVDFDYIVVNESSCSAVEQCVGGLGRRRLLRFSVEAINQGQATMRVDPPEERPDQFSFSVCHGHYHFGGFATYALLDAGGNVVVEGRKQAYCMEDTIQVMQGPTVGCSKAYDCYNQGIQPGWSDLYGNALDCQWLDITGIAPGSYQLQVNLNPNKSIQEISFDNNSSTVPVTIPVGN